MLYPCISVSSVTKNALRRFAQALATRKPELLALRVVRLGDRLREGAHAQDVALALRDADRAARVEQVERVRRLADLVVRGQRQALLDELQRFAFADVEPL